MVESTHVLARDAERRSFLDDSSLDHHAHHDRVPRVEHVLKSKRAPFKKAPSSDPRRACKFRMFIATLLPFPAPLRVSRARARTHLRQDFQLAREHRDVLVLVPLALLQFVPVGDEFVEQVVNNVRLEDLDSQRVRQFLRVPLDFHVERENRGVSTNRLGRQINYSAL